MKYFLFFLCLCPLTTFAEANYTVYFNNSNKYYSVTIKTPSSSDATCMYEWAVPSPSVTLGPNESTHVKIQDNNAFFSPCGNQPKSLTWHIHATPLLQYKDVMNEKDGTIEFHHYDMGGGKWYTGMNTSEYKGAGILFSSAVCGRNKEDCLNNYVTGIGGDDSGGDITVNFFNTDYSSCRDKAGKVFISNRVVGVFPTWGGQDNNYIKVLPSSEVSSVPADFYYEKSLATAEGMRFFKYSLLAFSTDSKLIASCNKDGLLGDVYLSR